MTACGIKEAAALLGVSCHAGRAEVESAFRRRALRCHPDRHPKDALAKVRFLRLSKAKEVLLQALKDARHPNVQRQPRSSAGASTASARERTERAERAQARANREGEASEAAREKEREKARERKEKRERREKDAKAAARAAQAAELKRREAEANMKKEKEQKEKEEAAKRRAAAMAEEMRRERIATAERRRGEIFEAFRKRKASKTNQETGSQQQNQAQRSSPQASVRIQQDPGFQLSDRHRKALQRLEKQRQGEMPRTTGSWWVVDSEVDRFLKREALQGYVP